MYDNDKKLPYPKSVFFIVSNEFCERFSYYGMRTILSIYLSESLGYTKDTAKEIYHVFSMLVYFFPVFGAMLADSLLGKFRTILYLSIVYAIGNVVLALAATPPIGMPAAEFSMVGLFLIALGTGGIKPCVAAFGGDQFVLPQQEMHLVRFFSMFYFSINSGSLLSTAITPILRKEVECFDQDECYMAAFAVPGALMIISIIIFALGKPLYKTRELSGNMVLRVSRCIGNAIKTKWTSGENKDHWLDHAAPVHGEQLVAETKSLLKILVLFIPLPVFWALFDQQGSAWTFQARNMDGDIGFYTILPDQMQVVNPLLILIFIPLFEYVIYPVMNKLHFLRSPLQRLIGGGVLAAVAFVISACISLAIEARAPVLPGSGMSQLRIYNTLPCDLTLTPGPEPYEISEITLKMGGFYNFGDLPAKGDSTNVKFRVASDCFKKIEIVIALKEYESVGYYFKSEDDGYALEDVIEKSENGLPHLSTLAYTKDGRDIIVTYESGFSANTGNTTGNTLDPDTYKVWADDKYIGEVEVKLGGVYTNLITETASDTFTQSLIEVTTHNELHMLLLIPQYVVITMAEIMYSVTGLEFSYSQAPKSMKSVIQACWLLTTAFGNLIVVIISSARIFPDDSSNFFLFAGLMLVDMVIFSFMASRYKYIKREEDSVSGNDDNANNEKDGIKNDGFLSE